MLAKVEALIGLSDVFCALQDSSFHARLNDFSDEQLRPFLPFLFTSTFSPFLNPSKCDPRLLARVVTFEAANRLQTLCSLPFDKIEAAAQSTTIFGVSTTSHFLRVGTEEQKMQALALKLLEPDDIDDANAELTPFVSTDQVEEAAALLSIAALHMPKLCTAERLAYKAVALQNGATVLAYIVANCVDLFYPVMRRLCEMKMGAREESPKSRQRAAAINALLSLCPSAAESTLETLFSCRQDVLVALRLASAHLEDSDLFLLIANEMLAARARPLGQLLHRGSARVCIAGLQERLSNIARRMAEVPEPEYRPESTTLLLCLCTLNSQSSYKPTPEDWGVLVSLLLQSSPATAPDSHLIVAVSIIVAFPALTQLQVHATRLAEWLRMLRQLCAPERKGSPALKQALLMIGIALSTLKMDPLIPSLVDILRSKVTIPPRHVTAMRLMFTDAGFSEKELAAMAAAQPVTPSLSADCGTARLPCHAVHDLLIAGVFHKYHVPIADWVERQLAASSTPVHPTMCSLLDRLAHSAVKGTPGISLQFIQESFSGALADRERLTRRVLCALFLLAYKLHCEATETSFPYTPGPAYPEELYTMIPLRYLLSVVEVLHVEMDQVRPWLVRSAAELFPFMLPTTGSVRTARESLAERGRGGAIDENTILAALRGHDQAAALAAVRKLESATLSEQVRLISAVVAATVASLSPTSPRSLAETACALWQRLEGVVPRMLIERSAREWLAIGGTREAASVEMVYDSPPLLFRVDRRIFASPAHFSCFLRSLTFFTAASRSRAAKEVLKANAQEQNEGIRTEREVLAATQEHNLTALMAHLLLEIADEDKSKESGVPPARLAEIRVRAAEQLHQMFIADRQLLKLVLWQTPPMHLLPWLVHAVPSLHVALEFVHEMLAHSDSERRVFAVALTVQIAQEYRIETSFKTTEMVLDVLWTLQRAAPTACHLSLFARVVPWLETVTKVFPQLSGEVTRLMINAATIAKARLALSSLVIPTTKSDEMKLIELVDESVTRAVNEIVI